MAMLADDLSVVLGSKATHAQGDTSWWTESTCPRCGRGQFFVVAGAAGPARNTGTGRMVAEPADGIRFLRCARCATGVVVNDGIASPGVKPLRLVRGLGTVEQEAWEEVRSVLSVSAWTAAVMLCRKIILHVAVAHGLPEKDGSNRSPNFDKAVTHLLSVGLITPPMKPWVDHIRKVGNEANHDLPATAEDSAMRVATFTEQLLILAYEMPAVMGETLPPPEPERDAEDDAGESAAG